MESTPNGKLSQTNDVTIYEQLVFQKQEMAVSARASVPTREDCWDQRTGSVAQTSALSLSLVPSDKNLFWTEQSEATKHLLPRIRDLALEGKTHGKGAIWGDVGAALLPAGPAGLEPQMGHRRERSRLGTVVLSPTLKNNFDLTYR